MYVFVSSVLQNIKIAQNAERLIKNIWSKKSHEDSTLADFMQLHGIRPHFFFSKCKEST